MAGYGDGNYAVVPPDGGGLVITTLFDMVKPNTGDPDIRSTIDEQYPNVAIITFDATNQFGGMWAKEMLDLNLPFSTEMYLYLYREAGQSGNIADGMTFTIHNDPDKMDAIGGAGEGLGAYKGRKKDLYGSGTVPHGRHLENSLVIEFDTYGNDKPGDTIMVDPEGGAHCALIIPTRDKIGVSDHLYSRHFNLKPEWKQFTASWQPDGNGGGDLTYYFNEVTRTHHIDSINTTFGSNLVYWGFTGSTGERTSVQAAAITQLPEQGMTVIKRVYNSIGTDIDGRYALPGDEVTFVARATATNIEGTVGPVIFRDQVSSLLTFVPDSLRVNDNFGGGEASLPDVPDGNNWLTVDTGRSPTQDGQYVWITFKATVNADAGGFEAHNEADVTAAGLDNTYRSNVVMFDVYNESVKKVSGSSVAGRNGAGVHEGDLVTYDITFANNHDTPETVVIEDALPAGVDYVSSTNLGVYDEPTHTVTWTLDDVAENSVATVTVTVRVNQTARVLIENFATVTVGTDPPDDTDPVTNPVLYDLPAKSVSDTSEAGQNGATVKKGDFITYNVPYENFTNATATVIVTDILPRGVDYLDDPDDDIIYDEDAHTVTWTLDNIGSGDSGTLTLVVQVNEKAITRIANYAIITVDDESRNTNAVINPVAGINCGNYGVYTKCRTSIKGRLLWDDSSNLDGTHPPSIDVVLLRDGEIYKSISMDTMNDTDFVFYCVPRFPNSTSEYVYATDEIPLPEGYTQEHVGYDIINRLIPITTP